MDKVELRHPEVSLRRHRAEQRLKLGKQVATKIRIYLDTNYWVYLCEVRLGRPRSPLHVELDSILHSLVDAGRVICPISYPLFEELVRQNDASTRMATAQVMDELSQSVSLQNPFVLLKTELMAFIRRYTPDFPWVAPLIESVWTKASYFCGEPVPTNTTFPPDVVLAIKKSFDDAMMNSTLVDMLNMLAKSDRPIPRRDPDVDKLNEQIAAFAHEGEKFQDFYKSEVVGALDGYDREIREVLASMFEDMTGQSVASQNIDPDDLAKDIGKMKSLLHYAITKGKLEKDLPGIHIRASLHAAVRTDKKRRFKPNDLNDIMHASVAVPYHNFVFMEGAFAHLLTTGPARLAQAYGTGIASKEKDVLGILQTLAA
jgi:hypothetical protein